LLVVVEQSAKLVGKHAGYAVRKDVIFVRQNANTAAPAVTLARFTAPSLTEINQ